MLTTSRALTVGFTSIRVLCVYVGVPDAPDAFLTLYGSSVHDLALSTGEFRGSQLFGLSLMVPDTFSGLLKSFTAPCV